MSQKVNMLDIRDTCVPNILNSDGYVGMIACLFAMMIGVGNDSDIMSYPK